MHQNERFEPSDSPDLTPNQLAHFYRDLHGNYDQLFLGTPSESIAFIYKSLGCLHSLQPLHHTHQTAFTDPTVPALKTEGWIMWQTIQVLLGPEEHSTFLREAISQYDVKDHDTGEIFPKILPRECFPLEPDKHMVAWYEGVSERLRKEAEDEERMKQIDVERDPDAPPPRRLHHRAHGPPHGPPRGEGEILSDDDGASVDSRGPALAYFRNPLYRHVDGRPSIVRRSSRRPPLSPRQTMMDKGKAAAASFGRIARNVGSPHLWDADRPHSRSHSRDPHARRKSHPDNRYPPAADDPPSSGGAYDNRYEPRAHSSHSHGTHGSGRHRRRSSQVDRLPVSGAIADDDLDDSAPSPVNSPPSGSSSSRHRHRPRPSSDPRGSDREVPLRHSKSHEPTPSQREGEDYFGDGYDESSPAPRRSSVHDRPPTPPVQYNDVGPSFAPSASPLFASHVAKHPQPPPAFQQHRPPSGLGPPPPGSDSYTGGHPPRHSSVRRAERDGRYQSRSPSGRPDDRRYGSPRPGRYDDGSPAPYEGRPPPPGAGPPPTRDSRDARYTPEFTSPPPGIDPRDPRGYPAGRPPPPREPRDMAPPYDPRERDPRDRDPRARRGSRADLPPPEDDYDDRRHSRPKQTRFADTGVSGRRYPDETRRRGS